MHKASTLSGSAVDVNGRYQYLDSPKGILGVGSYGTVYLGKEKLSGDSVAIKKVESCKLNREELDILKKLDSKHIVGLIDIQDSSCPLGSKFTYIVMELCHGDLMHHLKTQGRINLPDFNTIATGIALGYAELYKCHIVHRDLKPHNILLVYKWHHSSDDDAFLGPIASAKLTDFGISRQGGSRDVKLLNIAGTPLYMAPEIGANIIEQQEYDAQCDIWSIGVLLHECLTGQAPFDESGLCKLFLMCASCNGTNGFKPPSLPSCLGIPRHYQELLNDLMQLRPEDRLRPLEFLARTLDVITRNTSAFDNARTKRLHQMAKRTISTCDPPRKTSMALLRTVPHNPLEKSL